MKKVNVTAAGPNGMPLLVKALVSKTVTFTRDLFTISCNKKKEKGFSVVDVLVLVTGVAAMGLALPYLQSGFSASESGSAIELLQKVSTAQSTHYSQHNRFARLDEIGHVFSGAGSLSGNQVNHGKFVLAMTPRDPSDLDLQVGFTVTAVRVNSGDAETHVYEITQAGEVRQIFP